MPNTATCEILGSWQDVAFLIREPDHGSSPRYRVRVRIGTLAPSITDPLDDFVKALNTYEKAVEVLNEGLQDLVIEALFGREVSREY